MIKLVMVDDEPLVLVGLGSMLPWEDHGIEVCGTAKNGKQAMNLIKEQRPDIVIADIKMPVMSGLELMEQCREKYGRIPLFIILTSVEEYQHVKEAMRGQAVDYLVKLELTADMLLSSIAKAKDILYSLGRNESEGSSQQTSMQFFYDRFFMRLFTNHFRSDDHVEKERLTLAIDLNFDYFAVCCCKLDNPLQADENTNHLMSLYNSTTRMTQEVVSQYIRCYLTNLDLQHFTVTFCLNKQEADDYQQLLQDVLERAISLVKNYFNVNLECVIGIGVNSPLSLSDSYHTVQKGLANPNRHRPIHFYHNDPKKSYIVEQVKGYIKQNLEKRLTLADIADVFGYSPKYMSLLFSKHAGYSFVEYVTAVKIARARELLSADNARIHEIAEQLGFENAFYFSKVFKKVEGISPREYLSRVNDEAVHK